MIEWLRNRVWTASSIRHVPHRKRLLPAARNPGERLRWDARAAARLAPADLLMALYGLSQPHQSSKFKQLPCCHNNATVTCRFE